MEKKSVVDGVDDWGGMGRCCIVILSPKAMTQ